MKRLSLILASLLLGSFAFGQDSPTQSFLDATAPLQPELIKSLSAEEVFVEPAVLRGIGTLKIYAYLVHDGKLYSQQVFPMPVSGIFKVPKIKRLAWEHESRLGPLYLRTSLHYDSGSRHLEGSLLILNSESVNPVGDVQGKLALVVDDGLGVFYPRNPLAFGLEPHYLPNDQNISVWNLSYTKHVRASNMVPVPFVVGYGSATYNTAAFSRPDHRRLKGTYLIPPYQMTEQEFMFAKQSVRSRWNRFQRDTGAKTNQGYIFGHKDNAGGAGAQLRLGKHPHLGLTHPGLSDELDSDYLRSVLMWVEGRRKFFLDWPLVPATHPQSAYYFYGLHWISRWKAGFTRIGQGGGGRWSPDWGSDHGVSGYNLEHFRSMLPATAYYTQDPQLVWMVWVMGKTLFCTINDAPMQKGGYFGGSFTTMRGILRPLTTLIECWVVLDSYGDVYREEAAFLKSHIDFKIKQLHDDNPNFSKNPSPGNGGDEIPGHPGQKVIEVWQGGLGGDYLYTYHLLTGSAEALEICRRLQKLHVDSWRGSTVADLQMPKFVLASDISIGRNYSNDSLVHWNYALLAIPGLAGVDQDKRALMAEVAYSVEKAKYDQYRHDKGKWQHIGGPLGSWSCGDWNGFKPLDTQESMPWYARN